MKVKVISLPYIFQVLYVLCFTRPRYQVSVYRTTGPLVFLDATEINASVDTQCVLNVFLILWPSMNKLKRVKRVTMFNEKV